MAIQFVFFDLGKVLVHFDLSFMMQQVADVCGVGRETIAAALFDDNLHEQFELGRLSVEEYQRGFCERIDRRPDLAELHRAATEFFELNAAILPVISALRQTRIPLGILSNTCVTHWEYCLKRYSFLRECFQLPIASFEIGMLKPSAEIYGYAARRAGVAPEEIFFTDDIAENVEGAVAAGWDAVQFTSVPQLCGELRARGVPMNL